MQIPHIHQANKDELPQNDKNDQHASAKIQRAVHMDSSFT
jgi:hypothetical protein